MLTRIRRRRWLGTWLTAAVVLLLPASPLAADAPYHPAGDAVVLERLPPALLLGRTSEVDRLRGAWRQAPDDPGTATRLAAAYIRIARAETDPRYYGQAEAVLAPWQGMADVPAAILVLRATILQSRHAFTDALADIDRAVALDPMNAQAWLTRATILQVTGRPDDAAVACQHLRRLAPPLVTVTCIADAISRAGHAPEAYAMLERAAADARDPEPSVAVWSRTVLGEIAARLGDGDGAERQFRAATALDPHDSYLLAAYADFLLDRQRAADVLRLIPDDTRPDPLLLRRAIALQMRGDADAGPLVAMLGDRIAMSRLRGDRAHRREESLFALRLERDTSAALALAEENWQAQKEPADARLVLEAALAAGHPAAAQPVLDWIAATGLQDAGVRPFVGRLAVASRAAGG